MVRPPAARVVSPPRSVTAVALLVAGKACGEALHPRLRPVGRQRQRQKIAERLGALAGKVGQVDAERLPRDRFRRIVGEEMHAGGDHVGGDDQIVAGPLPVERGIVGQTEGAGLGGERAEVALDQREFAGAFGCHRHHAPNSVARSFRASVSRTALTIAGTSPS